jgi:oligopeptide transport system permease protein
MHHILEMWNVQQWRQYPLGMASAVFLALLFVLCWVGPWFFTHSPLEQHFDAVYQSPNASYWFGTDALGRDLFTRVLWGGRISFAVGIAATLVSVVIGLFVGMVAGYFEGWIDAVAMRVVDALYALPFTIFVILLTVLFGRSFVLLFVAIGIVEWLTMARIVRAQVFHVKAQPYFEAGVLIGLSHWQLILRYILPNILPSVVVSATLTVPAVMLLEATLSFLALGVQPPMTSWGVLIHDGVSVLETAPWVLIFPSGCFCFTLLALNFVGEMLTDHLLN